MAFAAISGLAAAPGAQAASITFNLSVEYSLGTTPAGTPPFLSATIDDAFGGPNTVRLSMSAAGLVGSENAAFWYFNFNPALDPTLLTFAVVNNAASVPNGINTGVNAFMADGGGMFDIEFDFPPPPGNAGALFTSGETVVYDLTYTSPIGASDFDFPSVESGGNGTWRSAAQVLRIGNPANGSGWIGTPVPESSTALLLGAGLVALGARRRR